MATLNQKIFEWLFSFSHHSFFGDSVIVLFAQYLPYAAVLGAIVLIILESGWRRRLLFFIETVLSLLLSRGIITELIRFFYHHLRPFDALGITSLIPESGYSFPSGHAAFFFALAMTFWYSKPKWGTWFFVFAVLNSVARVMAGVHWPLDILGGAAVGLLSSGLIHRLLKSHKPTLPINLV